MELQEMQKFTGFKVGDLPVRYLGVPLTSRKLNANDCQILVDRITLRINHWAARFLSYVERLQLIQSVILSMQSYWCRHFILPKAIIQNIDRLCTRFFWHGDTCSAKGARVSWGQIVLLNLREGLG